MIEKFLKAKHWQIFMIIFGLPILTQIIIQTTLAQNDPIVIMNLLPIVIIGWCWLIGVGLQAKVPNNVMMNVKKFKTFLIVPIVFTLLISMISVFLHSQNGHNPGTNLVGAMVGIIVTLLPFTMFCIFYCMYFAAKTIKTVELQREVSFSEFAGEFFLLWFFPIGIWVIQPKINQMIENKGL